MDATIQCLKCKKKVNPVKPVLSDAERAKGKCRISGSCPECKGKVSSFKAVDWYNKLSAEERLVFEQNKQN